MSIADLFGNVAPQYTMTQADKARSADYESDIKSYEDAYDKYKKDYDVYKTGAENYNQLVKDYNDKLAAYQADATAYNTALDAYKTEAQKYNDALSAYQKEATGYNDKLAAYTKQVEDYNAAVKRFNEGDRLIEFVDTDYYIAAPGDFTVARPDEFTMVRPDEFTMVRPDEFSVAKPTFSLTEPTAPADPGFDQPELDKFIKESQARARRRGAANAAALNVLGQGGNFTAGAGIQGGAGVSTTPEFSFSSTGFADGGAVVPPPDDPPVVAPARNEGALGLGYYIPPGFREFVRNLKPWAEALNLPYNIVAGTGRKTRDALDPSLPTEERIRAGGEAAIETGIQAVLPFAGRMAGQPLSRAIVESFFPVSTPKSAAEVAVDTVEDMGRRNMLKGAAATTGIAALAPDLAMEAMNRVPAAVTKTAAGAIGKTSIDMAAENILMLRRRIDEADELRDEVLEQVGDGVEAQSLQREIFNNQKEMEDVVRDSLADMSPDTYKAVSDEALERVGEFYYDIENLDIDVMQFKDLAKEAERRGLHNVQNEKGIFQFPNLKSLVEQVDFEMTEQALKLENFAPSITNVKPIKLEMTDDSGKSTEQLIKELGERAFKSQYEFKKKQLEMETDLSPEEIDRIARINASRKGRNMAEGGVVSFAPYLR